MYWTNTPKSHLSNCNHVVLLTLTLSATVLYLVLSHTLTNTLRSPASNTPVISSKNNKPPATVQSIPGANSVPPKPEGGRTMKTIAYLLIALVAFYFGVCCLRDRISPVIESRHSLTIEKINQIEPTGAGN